ncbi:MAG: AEC family transporter, partial [Oceanospirillaceae bacterium]|nr:AEC family transporter [Oceanospirillaceae bacterium]
MDMILSTVSAILLVMLLGYGLSKKLLIDTSFWQSVSKLSYWILFPILIVRTLANATIDATLFLPLLAILMVGLLVVLIYSLLVSRWLGLDGQSTSSMVQGGIRHNGFIGLAVLFDIFGLSGQALGALIIAVLVPPTNLISVFSMTLLVRKQHTQTAAELIMKELLRNPMLIAVAIGLLINFTGFSMPTILDQSMDLVSRAALPLLLLSVGASLKVRALKGNWPALSAALMGKLIVFPATLLAGAVWLNLPPLVTVCLVVFGA